MAIEALNPAGAQNGSRIERDGGTPNGVPSLKWPNDFP